MDHINKTTCLVTVDMDLAIKDAVLQLLDYWAKFYDNNNRIDIVYLDIKKAFDWYSTVDCY